MSELTEEGLQGSDPPEQMRDGVEAFDDLRTSLQAAMRDELVERIAGNPVPTPEEERMGAYVECLEPQVRAAVMALRQKGYRTNSSGFGGRAKSWEQHIQFDPVPLDDSALDRLEVLGAIFTDWEGGTGEIAFEPSVPDLGSVVAEWEELTSLMPRLGDPVVSQAGHFEDTAFVVNALNIGLTPDQLAGSPFATEQALQEGMQFVGYRPTAEQQ